QDHLEITAEDPATAAGEDPAVAVAVLPRRGDADDLLRQAPVPHHLRLVVAQGVRRRRRFEAAVPRDGAAAVRGGGVRQHHLVPHHFLGLPGPRLTGGLAGGPTEGY